MKKLMKFLMPLLLVLMLISSAFMTGCSGKNQNVTTAQATQAEKQTTVKETADETTKAKIEETVAAETSAELVEETTAVSQKEPETESTKGKETTAETKAKETAAETKAKETTAETKAKETTAAGVKEDGEYTTKDEVAEYLYLYGHLPSNFITKKDAQNLGWVSSKGNLWKVAPGKSIGGDYFGNNEGILPKVKGRKYYECDINFDGGFRGAERIIFSNDGEVYYTNDHYNSFEHLYGND